MKISELLNTYTSIEEDINKSNINLKKLREKKTHLSNTILRFMKEKNLTDLKYNDTLFLSKNNKSYSTISQKLLKDTIYNYFNDKNKADDLIKYILKNRTISESNELIKKIKK